MTDNETLLRVRVRETWIEAEQIRAFVLVGEGCELPVAPAGSHIDVHVAPGLVRQYSICNGPDEKTTYQIAVKREPQSRGGSVALFENKQVGDALFISKPRNRFPLIGAPSHVLFAGGIGITPLLSMLKHLTQAGEKCRLHYFVRSKECVAFAGLFERAEYRDKVTICIGQSPSQSQLMIEQALHQADQESHVYACGPIAFMNAVQKGSSALGRNPECFSSERFSDQRIGEDDISNDGFEVEFAASQRILAVHRNETIVQAMRTAGMEPRTSCEVGICGSCALRVLKGKIEHRDEYLTDEEKSSGVVILPCVSRAKSSKIVVDA